MLKKIIIILMIISCLGMGGYLGFEYKNADRKGPEISFEEEELYFDANEDEEEMLLEDVEAIDDVDGDVSDSLRIESIYQADEDTAIVVYVARDHQNNISKCKRVIEYESVKDEEKEVKKINKDDDKDEDDE